MLKTKNLEYAYDGKTWMKFPDIDCKEGEHWLLLGLSGSGKTTLLHLLGGLRTPKKGDVIIANTNLAELSPSKLDRFRGKHIGIVFQKPYFVRSLSVEENLKLAQLLAGQPVSVDRIKELLERLNVAHKLKSKTDALSSGEQQRVAIARALINKPNIILADEPTSALDDKHCQEVLQLLETQAAQEKATLLIVTHDARLKEKFANQINLQSN